MPLFKRKHFGLSSKKKKKKKSLPKSKTQKIKIKKKIKVKWDYESPKYKQWRTAVYLRDSYTCRVCGKKGGYIEAHHIKPKSKFPSLAFIVDNGITLCKVCHNFVTTREEKYIKFFNGILKLKRRDFEALIKEINDV